MSFPSILPLLLLLFLLLGPNIANADDIVSIESFAPYQQLRGCAACCFRECNARCYFVIGDVITCGHGDIYCGQDVHDSCFCRSDLQPTVTTYISSCVYKGCSSNLNDVGSAVYAYTEYCKSTGMIQIPAASASQTTTSTSTKSTSQTRTTAETSSTKTSTPTTSSTSYQPSFTGLTTDPPSSRIATLATPTSTTTADTAAATTLHAATAGEIVGSVLGALGFTAAVVAVYLLIREKRKNRLPVATPAVLPQAVGMPPSYRSRTFSDDGSNYGFVSPISDRPMPR
jgi:hypothetical protein